MWQKKEEQERKDSLKEPKSKRSCQQDIRTFTEPKPRTEDPILTDPHTPNIPTQKQMPHMSQDKPTKLTLISENLADSNIPSQQKSSHMSEEDIPTQQKIPVPEEMPHIPRQLEPVVGVVQEIPSIPTQQKTSHMSREEWPTQQQKTSGPENVTHISLPTQQKISGPTFFVHATIY